MVSKTTSQSVGGGFVKTNPNNVKIKQIVETTRCTRAEAEEALVQVGGELENACSWVLDHAGKNDWAVKTKGRKVANKKSESGVPGAAAEVKPETKKAESGAAGATTGQMKQDRPPRTDNGRGERRGGSGGNFRGGNRGAPGNRPGWNNKKAEPGASAAATTPAEMKPETDKNESAGDAEAAPATAAPGEVKQDRPPRNYHGRGERRGGGGNFRGGNHNHRGSGRPAAWKGGQVFTRTDAKATSPPASTETTQSPAVAPTPAQPEVIKTAAGPLSFAAVCAAGVKKPELPSSPTTTTTQASVSPDANLVSSEPQQIVETPFEVEKESSAELEAATSEVLADEPEASGELEAENPEIESEETLQETADEPKVSTPDHLEQIGQNSWAEKYYVEKAAPPVVEIRKPILDFSETYTVIFAPDKHVMKAPAVAVPAYTPPVSTPSTPAVFNSNAMPAGYAHSSYYHAPQAQQVQQQQQQPVLSQSQQQQMYNPLHYASYVPPPPGLSGPANNHLYHNQQYPGMHYVNYAMQMGQMYPNGAAANTNQVQNRRYDTNQHAGAGHNTMQHYAPQWNT